MREREGLTEFSLVTPGAEREDADYDGGYPNHQRSGHHGNDGYEPRHLPYWCSDRVINWQRRERDGILGKALCHAYSIRMMSR